MSQYKCLESRAKSPPTSPTTRESVLLFISHSPRELPVLADGVAVLSVWHRRFHSKLLMPRQVLGLWLNCFSQNFCKLKLSKNNTVPFLCWWTQFEAVDLNLNGLAFEWIFADFFFFFFFIWHLKKISRSLLMHGERSLVAICDCVREHFKRNIECLYSICHTWTMRKEVEHSFETSQRQGGKKSEKKSKKKRENEQ